MLSVLRHPDPRLPRLPSYLPPHLSQCRLATGRSALFHLARRFQPSAALMPCYVAEGVIAPFRAAGIPVIFYALTEALQPDRGDVVRRLAEAGSRPLLVLVDYFGYPVPVEPFVALAHQAGGAVLEDCAQALLRYLGRASAADFILYSLNKFLPVTDGAILLSNRADVDVALDEEALPPLPAEALAAYQRHLELNAKMAACDDGEQAFRILLQSGEAYDRYYAIAGREMTPHAQSWHSRDFEAGTDFSAMARRRRENDAAWRTALKEPPADLPDQTAPFAFPIRVPAERRGAVLAALRDRGVMAATLVDKWDFIPTASEHYLTERAFLAEHLLLPLGESVGADEIPALADHLKDLS